jgi:Ca-activated chloride channel family protein
MRPRISFDRTIVTVVDNDVVHLLVELEAPPAPDSERQPLDVVLVLDKSGSMGGDPLRSVKAATEHFLRLAGPDDRVGVVAFDNTADLVLELATHQFDTAAAQIRNISTGGSTNLSGGWLKAIEMLEASARPEALRRVIILTDGQANVGETDPDRLASIAASARSRSITTTTIGFGDGYDEKLLAVIADAGTGNDYWCAGPDNAPQIFNDEFEGLASTVAQNVSVELRPASEVLGMRVLNEFPITQVAGGMQVALGDAYGSERRRVVAELLLPSVRTEGPFALGEIIVRWTTFGDAIELHTVTIPLGIGVSADPDVVDTDADPAVREQVNTLRAAEERRNALEAMQRRDFDAASAAFSSAAGLLSEIGGDPMLIEELNVDAQRMARGDWDEMSSKKHFSERRMVNKGRRTRYDK